MHAANQISKFERRELEERHLRDDTDITKDGIDPKDDAGASGMELVEKNCTILLRLVVAASRALLANGWTSVLPSTPPKLCAEV